ncbi:Hint domain-containing protein [Aquimarina sp. MMG016]|uniref:NADase-type glycan-binding domain-containing protein n=1 Tax=Aquimarina sp. MMG016 TaxID=2822690 RepID=UPI001B3A35F8|nr:Hint domain-containing protein [Aquimarina sp. MMG016]MBQ4819601.1 hypothetical protein [Aquimarina sp. MMG016]
MNKLLSYLLLIWTVTISAQEIKMLYPTKIKELNEEGEKAQLAEEKHYAEVLELLERGIKLEDLPEEDQNIYNLFDEMQGNYWAAGNQGCSWYCGVESMELSASSYLSSQGKSSYIPDNAHDFSYKSAWVEGVEGHGIGEYLLYSFGQENPRITEIIIANGYVKSGAAWKNNSRIRKLKVSVDDRPIAILNLTDQRAVQHFTLDPIGNSDRSNYEQLKTLPRWELKFEILEVYPGDKYQDTVISEIYFDGIDVHCFAKGTMITMADHTQKPIELLQVGDTVLSYDLDTKTHYHAMIKALDNPKHRDLIKISLDNGTNITSTKDHPFISSDGAWVSYDPTKTQKDYNYDIVGTLRIGSVLQTNFGSGMVIDIRSVPKTQQTYTIVSLNKGNTFFANNILVGTEPLRNKKCDQHKIITR